jgi:serine/threonine-protein kinase
MHARFKVELFFTIIFLVVSFSISEATSALENMIKGRDGSEMVLVPEGTSILGLFRNEPKAKENPLKKVFLKSFYIDRYEVTNFHYKKCVRVGVCKKPSLIIDNPRTNFEDGKKWYSEREKANYPVVGLTWKQAVTYCRWAGKRLPLSSEWEKAARGVDGRRFPWGNQWKTDKANWDDDGKSDAYKKIAPVGSFPEGVSPYGIMDMAGNVREWVDNFILKGGSWYSLPMSLRAGDPGHGPIVERDDDMGFRCAMDTETVADERPRINRRDFKHEYIYDEYTKER